jgi:hypothetical protein
MSDTASIVERLGGPVLLSDRFKISRKAVEMWVCRGNIPGRWHVPLLMLAEERRVVLGMDELLSTHSQRAA